MANAYSTNFTIPTATSSFQCLWKLTRVMKSAGWVTMASGDGTNKDTSGNQANDLWGGSSNPLLDSYSSGSQLASTTMSTNAFAFPVTNATITVLSTTGFNAAGGIFYVNGVKTGVTYTSISSTTFLGCNGGPTLASSSSYSIKGQPGLLDTTVGWITMSGPQTLKIALNAAPTGTPVRGEIVTQATSGATGELIGYVWDSVGLSGWAVIGPQNTTETTTASYGATTVASGSNTVNINTFGGAGTLNVLSTTGFAASGTLYVNATGTLYQITYTGGGGGGTTFTGCTSTSGASATMATGGQVLGSVLASSATSVVVASTTGFASAGSFQVMTANAGLATVYYTGTSGGNTFTGCTSFSSGYIVTNFGVKGFATQFDAVHNLTGGISGATLVPLSTTTTSIMSLPGTPIPITTDVGFPPAGVAYITTNAGVQVVTYTGVTATSLTGCSGGTGNTSNGGLVSPAVVTFNREVMFGKLAASKVLGFIHYICADPVTESTLLLSYLSTLATCTALIPPGCGGTGNNLATVSPVTGVAMAMCVLGVQSTTGVFTTGGGWFGAIAALGSNAQIACVNNTPSTGITADGSFYCVLSTTTANQGTGLFFQRVDDSEPGDCDPYVFYCAYATNESGAAPVYSNLAGAAQTAISFTQAFLLPQATPAAGNMSYWGYQSRGNTVIARDIPSGYIGCCITNDYSIQGNFNVTTSLKAVCTPASAPPLNREPVTLFTYGGSALTPVQLKQIKGRLRWLQLLSVGALLDTYDSKTWLNIYDYGFVADMPAIAIGPYDGVTVPST